MDGLWRTNSSNQYPSHLHSTRSDAHLVSTDVQPVPSSQKLGPQVLSREYTKILLQKLRKQKASNVSGKYEILFVNVNVYAQRE